MEIYTKDRWYDAIVFDRSDLGAGDRIVGPANIIEPTGTNIIEPDWVASLTDRNHLILSWERSPVTPPQSSPYQGEEAGKAITPTKVGDFSQSNSIQDLNPPTSLLKADFPAPSPWKGEGWGGNSRSSATRNLQ